MTLYGDGAPPISIVLVKAYWPRLEILTTCHRSFHFHAIIYFPNNPTDELHPNAKLATPKDFYTNEKRKQKHMS